MHDLNKLISTDLVVGLSKIKFDKDHICEACQKGKQIRHSFKLKSVVSTSKPLELLHMDLLGPSRTMSLGGNYYVLVIVHHFSRFTWTLFLESKSDVFATFEKLAKRLQNTSCSNICVTRSDHGGEFQNEKISSFYEKLGIFHNFSTPITPQQNGVGERKNKSLKELARTMLSESSLPKYFWENAISTTCYVMNMVIIRSILKVSKVSLLCDNTSAINLTKNQIQHSRTKHIENRHHFIKDHVSNGDCEVKFIETEKQLTDIFTKSLPKDKFFLLRN